MITIKKIILNQGWYSYESTNPLNKPTMKIIITLSLVYFAVLNVAISQSTPLIYEVSQKFDVENARIAVASDGEISIIANHSTVLEDYDIGLEFNGRTISSVFSAEEDETPEYNFSILGDSDVVLHDFNFNDSVALVLIDAADSVVVVSEGETIYQSVFPGADNQVGIFHIDTNSDSIFTSYYIAPESSIHRTYPLGDLMLVTSSFKDSLVYVSQAGDISVVQGVSEYNACVFAIRNDGTFAWSYVKPTLGLSFVRSVSNSDEIAVIAIDGVNESYIVAIDEDGFSAIDLTFPSVNIHHIEFDDSENLFVAGQYNEVGGVPVNIGFLNDFFLPSSNEKDAFLAVVDESGTTQWAQVITGVGTDTAVDFDLTDEGEIYMTGCFEADGIFDQEGDNQVIFNAAGREDIFVAKYLVDGTFEWAETMGGEGTDIGTGVVADFGSVVLFGTFQNEIDINTDVDGDAILTDLNPDTERGFFFASYQENDMVAVEEVSPMSNFYPNPASDMIAVSADQTIQSISTIDGRMLKSVGGQQADVSDLPSGLYLVSIAGQSIQGVQLLTIQR